MEQQEFSVLDRFLADHAAEVEGRELLRLSADEEQLVIKLARGELDLDSIEQLMALLQSKANALTFLAEQIKSRRRSRDEADA